MFHSAINPKLITIMHFILKYWVFIKLQPLHLSLWRACPELVSGEIKREDKKIRNLINTHNYIFDLTLFYRFRFSRFCFCSVEIE